MRPVLSTRVVISRVSFVAYSDFYLCITVHAKTCHINVLWFDSEDYTKRQCINRFTYNFSEDVKCEHSLRNYDCLSHSGGAGACSPFEAQSARSWNPMVAIPCSLFDE